MRLAHPVLTTPLHHREGRIPVLVVEEPKLFRKLLAELHAQAEGHAGSFVLSVDYASLDCAEHLQVISNYVKLDLLSRRLQNRFQTLLKSLLREELAEDNDRLQQEIGTFLQRLALQIDYPLTFNEGEYVPALLKTIKIQPDLSETDLFSRLLEYLEINQQLLPQQCFILVDLHAYFSQEEIRELYQMAGYQKWRIIVLEHHLPEHLDVEDICILDSQLCELRIDAEGLFPIN